MGRKTKLIAAAAASVITFVVFAGLAAMVIPADSSCCGTVAATTMAAKPPVQPPIVGVFTGTYVDGVPVYRLPPVTVAVSRKAELARIEQEERLARAEQDAVQGVATRP